MTWLADNWATILVALILAAIVGAIIVRLVKNHRAGRSSCGCGCANCPSSGICHKAK